MHIQILNFQLKDTTDAEYRALCDEHAPAFAEVDGLLAKEWLANSSTNTYGGVYHLVNVGEASRYDWARAVLEVRRPGRELRPISSTEFERASEPPRWGILDTSRAAAAGVVMRPWRAALAEYLEAERRPERQGEQP